MKEFFKMTQKKRALLIYLALLGVTIVSSIALRTVAILKDFNPSTNFFEDKTLIDAASYIVGLGCLILFSYTFIAKKDEKLIASFTTPLTYVPTGAVIISFIFFAIENLIEVKSYALPLELLAAFKNATASFKFYLAILAILSLGYFILAAMSEKHTSDSRSFYGLCSVVFFAFYASYLYFDTTLSLNAPNKIVDQMAYIFAALFFLYEVRISLGRECWHLYMCFGFIASALTAYSSVPSLVYYFVKDTNVSDSIHETLLSFCIFVFITSRIILAAKLKEDNGRDIVRLFETAAEKRDALVKATDYVAYSKSFMQNPNSEEEINNEDSTEDVSYEEVDDDLIEIASANEENSAEGSTVTDEGSSNSEPKANYTASETPSAMDSESTEDVNIEPTENNSENTEINGDIQSDLEDDSESAESAIEEIETITKSSSEEDI